MLGRHDMMVLDYLYVELINNFVIITLAALPMSDLWQGFYCVTYVSVNIKDGHMVSPTDNARIVIVPSNINHRGEIVDQNQLELLIASAIDSISTGTALFLMLHRTTCFKFPLSTLSYLLHACEQVKR